MSEEFDMGKAIIPKSDQLNADDLIARPMTIKVRDVAIRGSGEQPVSIFYEGDNGKPYKPCKSMCRVMVKLWGADAKKYIGKSMTLYCDPTVKWGGMEVGGIRISHMTDISSKQTMVLTATKGSRKPYFVHPLVSTPEIKAPSLEDCLFDISCAPNLEGLAFKFKEATKLFTDEKARTAIIAAKDARKAELSESPAQEKPAPENGGDAIDRLLDPNNHDLPMAAGI